MAKYTLTLATNEESKKYGRSQTGSGLPNDLHYLENDQLAIRERGNSKSLRYDHMHLSVPDTDDRLVQWWGRASGGYHYPIGAVMKMIPTEGE